jgi:hypothetical protein
MIRVLISVAAAAAVLSRSAPKPPERDLLRGYAFSMCLAQGYTGTPMQADAERNAGLYLGAGSSGPEIYKRLEKAAKAAHPEKRAFIDNANMAISICLDFYESKELRAIVTGKK